MNITCKCGNIIKEENVYIYQDSTDYNDDVEDFLYVQADCAYCYKEYNTQYFSNHSFNLGDLKKVLQVCIDNGE